MAFDSGVVHRFSKKPAGEEHREKYPGAESVFTGQFLRRAGGPNQFSETGVPITGILYEREEQYKGASRKTTIIELGDQTELEQEATFFASGDTPFIA